MSEQVKLELFEFSASISPKLVNINAFKNLERLKVLVYLTYCLDLKTIHLQKNH